MVVMEEERIMLLFVPGRVRGFKTKKKAVITQKKRSLDLYRIEIF